MLRWCPPGSAVARRHQQLHDSDGARAPVHLGPVRVRTATHVRMVRCAARVTPRLHFVLDDLSGAPTRALIARHLAGMHASSPPESVHAFDVDRLREPGVTFWSAWVGVEIAGCGALKMLDADRGELKSMRVADPSPGGGAGG